MRRPTTLLSLAAALGLFSSCSPLIKLAFGVGKIQGETAATIAPYAQGLGMPAEHVFLAQPSFTTTHGRDTLLYNRGLLTNGLVIGSKKAEPGTTPLESFGFPTLFAFDGRGRGGRARFDGACLAGTPNRIAAVLQQLPAGAAQATARPVLGARQQNADFASVAAHFTTLAGAPLRFEAVRNGSDAYIAVFGTKYLPRQTHKALLEARAAASQRPDLRITVLYFACDFTPEAYQEVMARGKDGGKPRS